MLNEISLNFGNSESQKLSFSVQPINVIVGPNHSGKSLFLKEIINELKSREKPNNLILESITVKYPPKADIIKLVNSKKRLDHLEEYLYLHDPYSNSTDTIPVPHFYSILENPQNYDVYSNRYINRFIIGETTLLLNGQTRLDSMNWRQYSIGSNIDFQTNPELNNHINRIIKDDNAYRKLVEYVYDAFKVYPEVFINGSEARLVLSKTKIPEELRLSVKPDAIEFFAKSQNSDNTSDGRKAYIGIISEIIAGNPNIILLDEPEAFLHPPLARKLGTVMSKIATEENKQLFVSTHSSNFIMGCIESNVPINIIRLTYENESASAKLLENRSLSKMMKNPLLRSTNVLDGIFYKSVIVTESDSDRVFYQEINKRLKDFKPDWAIEDCLFLNAQNKQTVGWITSELRKIGIPTVSIVDLDLIKDGGNVFTGYLKSVNIPENQFPGLSANRDSIKSLFPNIEKKNSELKTEGIKFLKAKDKPLLEGFIQSLNQYGLFPVPFGELEAWLPDVPVDGHGNQWITKKFDLMGEDPDSETYIKPSENDVWLFIKNIKDWIEKQDKLGMK